MIRLPLLILLITISLSQLTIKDHRQFNYQKLELEKVDRLINLNGAYPEQTIKVVIRNIGEDPTKTYYHVVPANISRTIADIKFTASTDLKHSLEQLSDGYTVYKVNLVEAILRTELTLTITLRYINRYRNLPQKIQMFEDQLLEYSDYKHYFTPYKVNQQASVYKFQKLISGRPQPSSTEFTSAKYSENLAVEPFSRERVVVHGQNNAPQMVFTDVHKTVEISHWGNIAIAEKYSIVNKGPGLKGEFSRVEFNGFNENAGKNALKKTSATLPVQAWGLYYRDEVGNISTSRAFRDTRSSSVRFEITPRFSIFGGWKSNWEIGYNLPTQNILLNDGDHFELSQLPLGYQLDRIIAQKFTFTLVLPQGATNIKLFVNGQDVQYKSDVSFSFLDFVGRPTITYSRGVSSKEIQNNFKLKYDLTNKSLLRKPFIIFVTFFSIFVLVILTGRLELKTLALDKY